MPRQRGKSGFREGWSLNSLLPADDQKVPFHGAGQQDIVPWNAASGREWLPPLFVLSPAYRRTKAQSESRMNLAEVQPKFRTGIVDVEVVFVAEQRAWVSSLNSPRANLSGRSTPCCGHGRPCNRPLTRTSGGSIRDSAILTNAMKQCCRGRRQTRLCWNYRPCVCAVSRGPALVLRWWCVRPMRSITR